LSHSISPPMTSLAAVPQLQSTREVPIHPQPKVEVR
jgi:hypothetical protein